MTQILLNGVNLNELLEKIGQLIECKLKSIAPHQLKTDQSNFISRQEVSKLLMISLPTLNEYTKLGWLNSYKLGKRVLYKTEEVLACVDKVATHKHKKGGNHGA
jgi:hypothetical protein